MKTFGVVGSISRSVHSLIALGKLIETPMKWISLRRTIGASRGGVDAIQIVSRNYCVGIGEYSTRILWMRILGV